MANLTFFINKSRKNEATKNLTHLAYGNSSNIVNARLVYPCSTLYPIFELGTMYFDIRRCNYLYWEETGRYYTIDDIEALNNGIVRLHCTRDPFYSFLSQIRQINTVIERQENVSLCNPHIPDEQVVGRIDRQIVRTGIGAVGGQATGHHIALTTTGGTD